MPNYKLHRTFLYASLKSVLEEIIKYKIVIEHKQRSFKDFSKLHWTFKNKITQNVISKKKKPFLEKLIWKNQNCVSKPEFTTKFHIAIQKLQCDWLPVKTSNIRQNIRLKSILPNLYKMVQFWKVLWNEKSLTLSETNISVLFLHTKI